MSTIPGLFVIGEANYSDHGANRLGASALMQGLADGYCIVPQTIAHYFAGERLESLAGSNAFEAAEKQVNGGINRLLRLDGKRSVESIHRELGRILWEACGMSRSRSGLLSALDRIPELRQEFWTAAAIPGTGDGLNMALENAGRVADFLELGELMCRDALDREESCGCHLREEHQTAEGEARRNDAEFCHVSAWHYQGKDAEPTRPLEPLFFEKVELVERSYK